MSLTDTDSLTERIEVSAREVMRRSALIADVDLPAYLAAAVLPIVTEEVRKAKVEALREAAGDPALRLSGHSGISITRLRARATEYETGDQA